MSQSQKNTEAAGQWLDRLEERARRHDDRRALASVHSLGGLHSMGGGQLARARRQLRQATSLYTRIGDTKHAVEADHWAGWISLWLGDLEGARLHARQALERVQALQIRSRLAICHIFGGAISLAQEDLLGAQTAFQQALTSTAEGPMVGGQYGLGRVHLARGERAQALEHFEEARAAALAGSWLARQDQHVLAGALNAAEEVDPSQASLRIVGQRAVGQNRLDELIAGVQAGRAWHDPLGDCRFAAGDGLDIYAPNGRGLWFLNLSAPRALVERSGDLAAQTACGPVPGGQPVIGGLLLWADTRNYLRLERGVFGPRDVSLVGCLENEDVIIGCIRLPVGAAERVYLRLDRVGGRVEAHGSADGETWYTVGEAAFPVEDPVQVGLHAIGSIDRSIYPGAYPEGTAIRFESLQLWEM